MIYLNSTDGIASSGTQPTQWLGIQYLWTNDTPPPLVLRRIVQLRHPSVLSKTAQWPQPNRIPPLMLTRRPFPLP